MEINNQTDLSKEKIKQKKIKLVAALVILSIVTLVLSFIFSYENGHGEPISILMKDAVLHDVNRVSLFGLIDVNPALISTYAVTAILTVALLIIRIFVIPRFKIIPGKFQLVLEEAVSIFKNMAEDNSPHKNKLLAAYIFACGTYIFFGTLFELFGFQAVATGGNSITIPAPLSDINAAIAMGFLSYGFIMMGGITSHGPKGALRVLKDFSLPISMSFRLFGALLSGLLVTELVYYFKGLSFILPVVVAILFTLLHALIQAYVLTILTSIFYGEATE